MFDPPVIINVRDRVTPLRKLVGWLERAGHERIILLDNDSTYPELVEYLDNSPHEVVRLGRNLGSRALWRADWVPNEPYVYTDPDIIPIEDCPLDAVIHFQDLLQRHPLFPKVGFGFYLADVPATFPHLKWEQGPEINGPHVSAGARRSMIDTTFALYRPGAPFAYQAIRTDYPYQARHVCPSWYGGELSAEERHYFRRALRGGEGSSGADRVAA